MVKRMTFVNGKRVQVTGQTLEEVRDKVVSLRGDANVESVPGKNRKSTE